jgi:predicted nucleic acid-binding protein
MGMIAIPVIVDASFLVDGVLGDERVAEALEQWVTDGRMLLAPPIVWAEVGNALLVRQRVPMPTVASALRAVELAGVETADRGPEGVRTALELADAHRLSVYDALYLALAIDVDGELATRDRALAHAADAEGVPVVGQG